MKVEYVGVTKAPRYTLEPGDKFNHWTVIEQCGVLDDYRKFYLCKCDCGTEAPVLAYSLIHGISKSCGCQRVARAKQMGESRRKYPKVCSHCGKEQHYSKGLCRACYARQRYSGTLEYAVRTRKPPIVHDKLEKRRAALAQSLVGKNDREKMVVKMLGENHPYEEIAVVLGVSRQRVDQMIRAMCKRELIKAKLAEAKEAEQNE